MTCKTCAAAYSETWPRLGLVIRCGADGPHKGHVARTERPAWCPKKEKEKK